MLQLLPNWFHGLVPGSLWPNRPREFYACTLSILPLTAGATITREIVFSKKTDVLVFGGSVLSTDATGSLQNNPRGGTLNSQIIQLSNDAANELYSDAPVMVDSLFSSWGPILGSEGFVNAGAKLPCFWPIPITVRKGGSLTMRIEDLNGAASPHMRFTFYTALVYRLEQREVA